MRIDDILSTAQSESVYAQYRKEKEEDESRAASAFGGVDTVSISPEARTRLQEASGEGGQKEANAGSDGTAESAESGGASGAGGAGATDGTADQLEALEKQLKKLQSQLLEVANDESIPADEKEAKMAAIQGQISQISAQIAELKTQTGKGAAA